MGVLLVRAILFGVYIRAPIFGNSHFLPKKIKGQLFFFKRMRFQMAGVAQLGLGISGPQRRGMIKISYKRIYRELSCLL